MQLWVKRDDLTGLQLSGNKVRKLEFLMAEALAHGHDSVITIGGVQSNHARATAVAARYLGLECHLVLRTSRALVDGDPGLTGNLLVERLAGAHLHMVTKEEYQRSGSAALGAQLVAELSAAGKRPYLIPVGGSNALGSWGYLEAVRELEPDIRQHGITDIAMACGSGGTTAGLALGVHLARLPVRVHAYGVCDDPAYFYAFIDGLLAGMGASPATIGADARGLFRAVQAKGVGYALSTAAELSTVQQTALATGIILDPVYSGKALHAMLADMRDNPDVWAPLNGASRRVLFLHTGGLLGTYDKVDQLQPLVAGLGRCHRMQVQA